MKERDVKVMLMDEENFKFGEKQNIKLVINGEETVFEATFHEPKEPFITTFAKKIINSENPTITTTSAIKIVDLALHIVSLLKENNYENFENVVSYLTTDNVSRENAKLMAHMILQDEELKLKILESDTWTPFAESIKSHFNDDTTDSY